MHRANSRSLKSARPATSHTYRAVEFFAGIGLVRLALERQRWRVVFANDIDPQKLEMYEANFGKEDFHLGDIHKLHAADIPDAELFTASFPCNDRTEQLSPALAAVVHSGVAETGCVAERCDA